MGNSVYMDGDHIDYFDDMPRSIAPLPLVLKSDTVIPPLTYRESINYTHINFHLLYRDLCLAMWHKLSTGSIFYLKLTRTKLRTQCRTTRTGSMINILLQPSLFPLSL